MLHNLILVSKVNLRGNFLWIYDYSTCVEMLARLKFSRKYVALFKMLAHLKFGGKYVTLLSFENMCRSCHLCEPPAELPLARQVSHPGSEMQQIKHNTDVEN